MDVEMEGNEEGGKWRKGRRGEIKELKKKKR